MAPRDDAQVLVPHTKPSCVRQRDRLHRHNWESEYDGVCLNRFLWFIGGVNRQLTKNHLSHGNPVPEGRDLRFTVGEKPIWFDRNGVLSLFHFINVALAADHLAHQKGPIRDRTQRLNTLRRVKTDPNFEREVLRWWLVAYVRGSESIFWSGFTLLVQKTRNGHFYPTQRHARVLLEMLLNAE